MSGLGLLATAFAGGAQAINQQATGDIDKQNRLDIAQEMSRIQEQANMRLAENQARLNRQGNVDALTDTRDFQSSDETIAARGKVADADSATRRRGLLADATDEPLNTALRSNKTKDADAAAKSARDAEIAAGNDPLYLKAVKGIATAQHFFGPADALAAEQLKNLKAVGDVRKQLANETDPDKREILKNKEMDLLGTGLGKKDLSIALASTENAAAKARSTLSDPMATEEAKASAKDSLSALQWSADNLRKQMGFRGETGSTNKAPPDGTLLKDDKTGEILIVKDGVPVPRGQATAKSQASSVATGSGLLSTAAVNQIPAPPPETVTAGLSTRPSPAFAAWKEKFGQAWQAQQDAENERRAGKTKADAERLRTFNPYQQSRPQ